MKDKKTYQEKIEAEFNRLSAEIGDLLEKCETKAKSEYEKQSKVLAPKLKAAQEKLQDLKKASNEAWGDVKPGFEKAWAELKRSFEDAVSRFKQNSHEKE